MPQRGSTDTRPEPPCLCHCPRSPDHLPPSAPLVLQGTSRMWTCLSSVSLPGAGCPSPGPEQHRLPGFRLDREDAHPGDQALWL